MQNDLTTLAAALTSALSGLERSETQAAPAHRPDKWNIQQIVEHLLLTYRSTSDSLEDRIRKGTATRAPRTVMHRVAQCAVIRLGYLPSGRKAPQAVTPSSLSSLRSGDELAGRVQAELSRLRLLCDQGARIFGERSALSHGVLGPMTIQQWRRFHLVHGLHHLRQIQTIRKDRTL